MTEQVATQGTPTQGSGRPTFLTVLCVLTFIGVAWGLISSVSGYFTSAAASKMMESAGSEMQNVPGMDALTAMAKYAGLLLGVNIIGNLLCLVGALQMWKLKKLGYYVYILGQVIPLGTSVALIGASIFAGIALLAGAIVPVLFIVLYGLNLKHMS